MKFYNRFFSKMFTAIILTVTLTSNIAFTDIVIPKSTVCHAERDYTAEMEERKALPIQSNDIENWPTGPSIGAQAAILMEMNTHTILYAKNIHEKGYPASTTKILTCLLAMQNCTMDETVTFSHDSIYDVPSDGSRLGGVDTGDTIGMEQALYCVLVQSANEVATAVGEHVAQKLGKEANAAAFSEIMNEKAKQLGCKDSHFANANGLYDDNHYTSVYDLALIGSEFFNNELLCKMSSTPSYHFKLNRADENEVWISSKNQLYKGKPYEYEYLLGSKTGFVSQARQTLVSAAEKNGMKLVCVIFTEETPHQFEDTVALFQYGFENFKRVSINDNETKYKISTIDFFDTQHDLFGDSTPLISMQNDTYVILPNTAEFEDTVSTLSYNNDDASSNVLASINYSYSDVNVGSCDVIFSKLNVPAFSFGTNIPSEITQDTSTGEMTTQSEEIQQPQNDTNVIFVNVRLLIIGALLLAAFIALIFAAISFINSYSFSPRGQSSKRRRLRRRENRTARRNARRNARRQKKLMKRRRKGMR